MNRPNRDAYDNVYDYNIDLQKYCTELEGDFHKLIVTYEQWTNGNQYVDGHYSQYTSAFDNYQELEIELKHWGNENPMIIKGIWEI